MTCFSSSEIKENDKMVDYLGWGTKKSFQANQGTIVAEIWECSHIDTQDFDRIFLVEFVKGAGISPKKQKHLPI